MKKNIAFVKDVNGGLVEELMTVDLTKLSRTAMALALSISTTDRRDDHSLVVLRCKYTNRDLFEKVLADDTGRYTQDEKQNASKRLAMIRSGDMWSDADRVQTAEYQWDTIRDGETPEAYFERHAGMIETEAMPYLQDSELKDPLPEVKYLRIKAGLTQRAFSELLHIPLRTVENWETGVSTPPQYVVELIEYRLFIKDQS